MPRFSYRTLSTYTWDKHEPHLDWKRGGASPDRILYIVDSGRPEQILVTDEKGEDWRAFCNRAEPAILDYLNRVGEEGWQVIESSISRSLNGSYRPSGNLLETGRLLES